MEMFEKAGSGSCQKVCCRKCRKLLMIHNDSECVKDFNHSVGYEKEIQWLTDLNNAAARCQPCCGGNVVFDSGCERSIAHRKGSCRPSSVHWHIPEHQNFEILSQNAGKLDAHQLHIDLKRKLTCASCGGKIGSFKWSTDRQLFSCYFSLRKVEIRQLSSCNSQSVAPPAVENPQAGGFECLAASTSVCRRPVTREEAALATRLASFSASPAPREGISFPGETSHKMRRASEPEEAQLSVDDSCAVCLEILVAPHSVEPCSHVFCVRCLRLLNSGSSDLVPCPICRAVIFKCIFVSELDLHLRRTYPTQYSRQHRVTYKRLSRLPPLPECRSSRQRIKRSLVALSQRRIFYLSGAALLLAVVYGLRWCHLMTYVGRLLPSAQQRNRRQTPSSVAGTACRWLWRGVKDVAGHLLAPELATRELFLRADAIGVTESLVYSLLLCLLLLLLVHLNNR